MLLAAGGPVLLSAGLALLAWALGLHGTDLAAQVYRADLVRRHGLVLWDPGWYGGYAPPAYSVLAPAVAAVGGIAPTLVAWAALAAWAFGRLVPRRAGAWWFAAGTLVAVVVGQYPYLAGEAVGLCALVAATRRGRWPLAGVLGLLAGLLSPLAAAFLVLAAGVWVGALWRGSARGGDGARAGMLAAAVGAAVPIGVVGLAFPGDGPFPFAWGGLVVVEALCALALTPLWRLPRWVRAGFGVYGLATLASFLVANPVGGNAARLAGAAGVAVVVGTTGAGKREPADRGGETADRSGGGQGRGHAGGTQHEDLYPDGAQGRHDANPAAGGRPSTGREHEDLHADGAQGRHDANPAEAGRPHTGRPHTGRPSPGRPSAGRPHPLRQRLRGRQAAPGRLGMAAAAALLPFAVWQWAPATAVESSLAPPAADTAAFYRPLLAQLEHRGVGATSRVEVVPTRDHWESVYVAEQVPIARGWERQLDVGDDPLFYRGRLTAARYTAWLRDDGVSWVALPHAALDYAGRAEAALLHQPVPGLRRVWAGAGWTLWSVTASPGLLSGSADGRLLSLGPDHATIGASHPGSLLLRVRWTRYWSVAAGNACLARQGPWTRIDIRTAGRVVLGVTLWPGSAGSGNCP